MHYSFRKEVIIAKFERLNVILNNHVEMRIVFSYSFEELWRERFGRKEEVIITVSDEFDLIFVNLARFYFFIQECLNYSDVYQRVVISCKSPSRFHSSS